MKLCQYHSLYWTPITGFKEYSCELPSVNEDGELCKFHDPLYWKINPKEVEREFVSILQKYNQDPNVKYIVFIGVHIPKVQLNSVSLKKPLIILDSEIHGDFYIFHSNLPSLWISNTKIDGDLIIMGSNIEYLEFRRIFLNSLLIAGGFMDRVYLNKVKSNVSPTCGILRHINLEKLTLRDVLFDRIFIYDSEIKTLKIISKRSIQGNELFLVHILGLDKLIIKGHINLKNISFIGTHLPKATILDGIICESSKNRIITLDEINLGIYHPLDVQGFCVDVERKLWSIIKKEGIDTVLSPSIDFEAYNIEYTLDGVLRVYRELRNVLEENLLYDIASLCFISEMEIKRNYYENVIGGTRIIQKRNWFYRLFSPLGLYRLISLYGEDIKRALLSLAITILGYSVGYMKLNNMSFSEGLYLSTATIFQLKGDTLIELSEKIIGLIFLANIAVTLRRNLQRKSKIT